MRQGLEAGVVEVSDLRSHMGFWLRMVSNAVSQEFARSLAASGVAVAEWVVLREMYDSKTMLPSVLAARTGMTRGAASKLVDRLLKKGLVTRDGRKDDRRYQDIGLTPSGRRLVPRLAALADENDERFFRALTSRERNVLTATMKKLAQAHELHVLPTE